MTKSCFALRLFFAYCSLIVRLTFAHRSLILYGLYRVTIKRNNQYLFIVV